MIPTRLNGRASLAGIVVGALLSLPLASFALPGNGATSMMEDENPAAALTAKLNKKQFQNVKITVDNGVATLTGNVDLYEYKEQADKIAHKAKGISAVRNEIQVGSNGASISDEDLQQKLVEKLQYDRVGYGNAFNAISVKVHDGAVTLGGHARTDVDRDSALALVSTYPGVKDVNDEVQVDPVSIMDDRTRIAVARAIYSFPSMNKYAINPAAPIRVSVQNGNVELYGVVDSQADKDVANLRANQVPGVFSVKNYLQVANQTPEKGQGKQ